jgi:hypothetical protein
LHEFQIEEPVKHLITTFLGAMRKVTLPNRLVLAFNSMKLSGLAAFVTGGAADDGEENERQSISERSPSAEPARDRTGSNDSRRACLTACLTKRCFEFIAPYLELYSHLYLYFD